MIIILIIFKFYLFAQDAMDMEQGATDRKSAKPQKSGAKGKGQKTSRIKDKATTKVKIKIAIVYVIDDIFNS